MQGWWWWTGQQKSEEPCEKVACNIQACLSENNFDPKRCAKYVELLKLCCKKYNHESTHCDPLPELLLKINSKRFKAKT